MNKQAVFYLSILSVSYGIFVVMVKHLLNLGEGAIPLVASTGLLSLLIVMPFILFEKKGVVKISKKNWIKIIILGLFATFLGNMLIFVGQNFTTATNAGFILKLTALSTIPFAYFMLREKIGKRSYLALAVMLVGTFLLVTQGSLSKIYFGDLILILYVIIMGFTNTLAKILMKDMKANVVSALRMIIGNLFLLGVFIPIYGYALLSPIFNQMTLTVAVSILSVVYMFSFYKGIELAGPSKATIFFLTSAVLTAVFSFVFLGEMLALIPAVGAAMILVGGYLLTKSRN